MSRHVLTKCFRQLMPPLQLPCFRPENGVVLRLAPMKKGIKSGFNLVS
jgi:hypothetical protein